MADQETSHIIWVFIAVAITAGVFLLAKPALGALGIDAFDKVEETADRISTTSLDRDENLPVRPKVDRPDKTDAKWLYQGTYAINGYYVSDKDGNSIINSK